MERRRDGGQYVWTDVYAAYLGTRASAAGAGGLEPELGVEPFVGPVRIGLSKGRGRGLFLTEDVAAGQLLFSAEAVVAGDNEQLLATLVGRMLHSAELQDAVLSLSRGAASTETTPPRHSIDVLAAPSQMRGGPSSLDASVEDLQRILCFNQFALPRVNAKGVPVEVTLDSRRSGLWLLPALLNHSCLPNVAKVVVRDCIFVRAGKALKAGTELLECYINPLLPLEQRRDRLQHYGFTCRCARCQLEEAILDPVEVRGILRVAGRIAASGEPSDEAVRQAEAFVKASIEKPSASGVVAAFDEGGADSSATPPHASGAAFGADGDHAFLVLLAGLAEPLREHAVALRSRGRGWDSALTWRRLLSVVVEVAPCSEVAAAISAYVLKVDVDAAQMDCRCVSRADLCIAALCLHRAYGGGAPVWAAFNSHMLGKGVLDAATAEWEALLEEASVGIDGQRSVATQQEHLQSKAQDLPASAPLDSMD